MFGLSGELFEVQPTFNLTQACSRKLLQSPSAANLKSVYCSRVNSATSSPPPPPSLCYMSSNTHVVTPSYAGGHQREIVPLSEFTGRIPSSSGGCAGHVNYQASLDARTNSTPPAPIISPAA
ncbi:hypothetical protein GALMADRAFT_1129218 [Galerina marginata CBS 339.88]|uniref:Uncharacterized protein n=1 Tax=Galerina marginata (strain CBS 339.88) TaxID=685588 RepID=A0A067SAV4_GALM3|nr:hypothetical protein GALMADRAFT_1129218 [Galerina marginata CBS 339.88]